MTLAAGLKSGCSGVEGSRTEAARACVGGGVGATEEASLPPSPSQPVRHREDICATWKETTENGLGRSGAHAVSSLLRFY